MIFYALQYLSITVNLGFKGGVGSELSMYQGNTPKELFQIHSSTTRPKNPSYSKSTTVQRLYLCTFVDVKPSRSIQHADSLGRQLGWGGRMLASTSEIYRSLVRSNCGVITEYRICRSKMMRTIVYLVVSVLSRVAKQDLLEASPPLISRGGLNVQAVQKN